MTKLSLSFGYRGNGTMKWLILSATCLALTACSSATTIRVSDPDVLIFVNDEFIGTGSGRYRDRKPAFTQQEVTLRKDGCEDQTHRFRRNERPDVGAIASAYFLVLPIAWFTQYKNRHSYEFGCLPG